MGTDADIIIAGAGITGCHVAKKLADMGYKVILSEKSENMKEDSGIVSKRFFRYASSRFAKHEIKQMNFISPSGKLFTLSGKKPFAWIINRNEIIRHFRKECRGILSYERVLSINAGKNGASVRTDENNYSCKLVIGCDGTYSTARRFLGEKNPKIIFGMLTRTKKHSGNIRVYLNKYYSPDFFGWFIPQTGEWGTMSSTNPKDYFEHFGRAENLKHGEIHASPIPMGFVRTSYERAMLVGEAAGQTKPLTGGGYVFGLECSDYAIKAADLCMQQNRFGMEFIASSYDRWKAKFAGEIRKQLLMRKFYRRMTNSQIDKIFGILGHHAEHTEVVDYDMLSKTFMQMPKMAIVKAVLSAVL